MSTSYYQEWRPAYTGEYSYSIEITIDGSGSIAGQSFEGKLTNPNGEEVEDAVTVVITDSASREITATIAGQTVAGDYVLSIRRTDDASALIVAWGVLEIEDPHGRR